MADQQTPPISGYRELNQAEIDLINEAKRLEALCLAFHKKVEHTLAAQPGTLRQVRAHSFRWHSIARKDIETGFMALIRCIAQPQPIPVEE